MAEGATAALPCEAGGKTIRPVGSDELAEGLMLVRASTMKVIRLQLAMERRDRRLALQTMDELVDLDGRIRDFLGDIPVSPAVIAGMEREMEEQRIALTREKFTLTAGIGKASAPERGWIEHRPAAELSLPSAAAEESETLLLETEAEEPAATRPWTILLLALLFLVVAVVCAGMLLGTDGWHALVAHAARLIGSAA